MKAVILAGGFGTRITEESRFKPKPMIEIGGHPILWHIMKLYSFHGINEFIICAGYRQEVIKQYFFNYHLYNSDITIDIKTNALEVHNSATEPWKITVVDTGLTTMTGGRIKRIQPYINDEPFFLTYGDGVSNVNITKEYEQHMKTGALITITTYNAENRFGAVDVADNGWVRSFREKAKDDGGLINIGFMVCKPSFVDLLDCDETILEREPMQRAILAGGLAAYRHEGFWGCMDTLREKIKLEELWASGAAPWKVWDD